jgi:hypothetical protein
VISICSKWLESAVFSLSQSAIPASFLGPSKSTTDDSSLSPAGKNLMVGYPLTPNLAASYLFSVASTLATLTSPLSVVARAAHSGANL